MENQTAMVCEHCGQVIEDTANCEWVEGLREHWCKECVEAEVDAGNLYCCPDCGNYFEEGDMVYVTDIGFVCEDCVAWNSNYYHCDRCGEWFSTSGDPGYELSGERMLCTHCYNYADVSECAECGELFYDSEMVYDEAGDDYEGDYVCRWCWDNVRSRRKRVINNYGYKPTPKFKACPTDVFKSGDDRFSDLVMGVELEIDKGDDSPESVAEDILDVSNDVYCKHDGSLDEGVEIVSEPCTLNYHLNELGWPDICRVALDHGFKSHDAGTCGLHVHVGVRQLGANCNDEDLTKAKLLLMMEMYRNQLMVFSRRRDSQLSRWAAFPRIECANEEYLLNRVNEIRYESRYVALNLTNRSTVEFRIFRGTLNVGTLFATFELVHNFCTYAKTHTIDEILNSSWKDVVTYNKYPELDTYLADKCLDVNDAKVIIPKGNTKKPLLPYTIIRYEGARIHYDERPESASVENIRKMLRYVLDMNNVVACYQPANRYAIANGNLPLGSVVRAMGPSGTDVGVVIAYEDKQYCIAFDSTDILLHSASGRSPDRNCWWCEPDEIKHVYVHTTEEGNAYAPVFMEKTLFNNIDQEIEPKPVPDYTRIARMVADVPEDDGEVRGATFSATLNIGHHILESDPISGNMAVMDALDQLYENEQGA